MAIIRRTRKPIDRFLEKVREKNGCWEWAGSKCNKFGHGSFTLGNSRNNPQQTSAHRASWILHRGKIIGPWLVLHKCKTRSCVNPKHLYLGTQKDNVKDSIKDGTKPRGEEHRNSKITEDIVKEIRSIYVKRESSVWDIGKRFGIAGSHVSRILNRKAWKHV